MCTSFTGRKEDLIIAMNFDNNGMPFRISTTNPEQFVVLVGGGKGLHPSFGVNCDGTFMNSLMVDSNGKGLYKRAGKKVSHTSKLISDVLAGTVSPDELGEYLKRVEIVNVPGLSVHNMIVDKDGNVWVVEPGRGVLYSPASESPYFVMSNFSLCDAREKDSVEGDGADRYQAAGTLLKETDYLDVNRAFEILKAVKQSGEEWTTAFSMVYSRKEHTVYYCFDGDFENRQRYSFPA